MGKLFFTICILIASIYWARMQAPLLQAQLLYAISLVQLVGLGIVYRCLARLKPVQPPVSPKLPLCTHTAIAFLVLCALVLVYCSLTAGQLTVSLNWLQWMGKLLYFMLLIALPEELLFRWLPFRLNQNRTERAVVYGSVLFSIYHINQGILPLLFFFSLGLLFGVMRYYGCPILLLIIIHGLYDLAVGQLWPGAIFRFGSLQFWLISPILIFVLISVTGFSYSLITRKKADTPCCRPA
ncbi:CPBP family glutamic-type intramembrane protease [Desulfogranum mediterraneum]|uniref:CPBP family glutamic-type intramembrane protease n=1 Tax=Desulfogranum mediterraneum TaxID=160661 RepID=UPI00048F51CE|nr:CPBP family glutamic-type intramembrane protease [Desulfogranum mediterraneum]